VLHATPEKKHTAPMRAAYLAAASACGNSDPNPAVGAVLVSSDGKILGTGKTRCVGHQHAERDLLEKLGGIDLRSATLYVTLEPCCHHGRTPPCTDAILEAGISRVIIGERDFAAEVAGRSIDLLKAQGVNVSLYRENNFARERWFTTDSFFFARRKNRPRVILKWAQTQDGALAPSKGTSGPISGKNAALITATLRSYCKYTLASAITYEIDQPRLTVRYDAQAGSFSAHGLSDFFSELIRSHCNADVSDHERYKSPMQGHLVRGENFEMRLAQIGQAGFNSVLIEAGPLYSEKLLNSGIVDAIAIYRSKEKTANKLWQENGRNNTVSRNFVGAVNTIADFSLLESADLGEDEFFFFARN